MQKKQSSADRQYSSANQTGWDFHFNVPCYTERIKTVSEERRTVEFCSKFALISFIAFEEFLIHVNKFRDYKNYLRSSLNSKLVVEIYPNFPIPICAVLLCLILYPSIREYIFFCNV
jgi:hypothetical protein